MLSREIKPVTRTVVSQERSPKPQKLKPCRLPRKFCCKQNLRRQHRVPKVRPRKQRPQRLRMKSSAADHHDRPGPFQFTLVILSVYVLVALAVEATATLTPETRHLLQMVDNG